MKMTATLTVFFSGKTEKLSRLLSIPTTLIKKGRKTVNTLHLVVTLTFPRLMSTWLTHSGLFV